MYKTITINKIDACECKFYAKYSISLSTVLVR